MVASVVVPGPPANPSKLPRDLTLFRFHCSAFMRCLDDAVVGVVTFTLGLAVMGLELLLIVGVVGTKFEGYAFGQLMHTIHMFIELCQTSVSPCVAHTHW